jgi:hypothetical protein
MSEANQTQTEQRRRLILYVCSGCVMCSQVTPLCMEWADAHPDIALEVVPVLEQPEQVIRLGITHTPALAQEGALLAQNLTVDELVGLFDSRLQRPKVQ